MDAITKLVELANLTEITPCCLNHGPGIQKPQACNYIVQPIGYSKNNREKVATDELSIPICQECVDSLCGNTEDEWTLVFCLDCSSNHWVSHKFAKNKYQHRIIWVKGCPECLEEGKKPREEYFTNKITHSHVEISELVN